MNIRNAEARDREEITKIYLSAFDESENLAVAKLATDLLSAPESQGVISLILEEDDALAGHVAFSPVRLKGEERFSGYILAPLAVDPDHQRQGVGKRLVEYGLQKLNKEGVQVIFVYGDPAYYGRFGFESALAENYIAPYKLTYSFGWQAVVMSPGDLTSGTLECVDALCDPGLW